MNMNRFESSSQAAPEEPTPLEKKEGPFGYSELPGINAVVEASLEQIDLKNNQALADWKKDFLKIKSDLIDRHIDKNLAQIEVKALLGDLEKIKELWRNSASAKQQKELNDLLAEVKTFRENQGNVFLKFRKWLAPLLVAGTFGAGGVVKEKYQEFDLTKTETSQLSQAENEFLVPELPDSVLVMPEKAKINQTDDLFKSFAQYVKSHEEKGFDLAVRESKPGLLGVYLKFGRQLDRSVNFSDKFLPLLSKKVGISSTDLQTMQDLFQQSIYETPPTMGGGGGTSSVFYSSEDILKFDNHEDFYANQLNTSVELAKQKIPEIENAPAEIQPALTKALGNFLVSELAIRAFDERIKDAIKNKREFELKGFEGAYNDDRPSLFVQQAKFFEKRERAISDWYETLKKNNPAVASEENLAQLAVRLQGWFERRSAALEVSEKEGDIGLTLGGNPEEWNDFVKKGDAEFRQNSDALKTLLVEAGASGESLVNN